MLARVACNSFNSRSIFASVSLALETCKRYCEYLFIFHPRTRNTYSLGLKRLDSLYLCIHIVAHRLEFVESLFQLINNGLVLENRTVVSKVNSGGLLRELVVGELCVVVTFAECLEGGDGFCMANIRIWNKTRGSTQHTLAQTQGGVDA